MYVIGRKVVLIAGASRGIGKAIAKVPSKGAIVVGTATTEEELLLSPITFLLGVAW